MGILPPLSPYVYLQYMDSRYIGPFRDPTQLFAQCRSCCNPLLDIELVTTKMLKNNLHLRASNPIEIDLESWFGLSLDDAAPLPPFLALLSSHRHPSFHTIVPYTAALPWPPFVRPIE